ncbi:MAG: DUF4159 domain-containing protein [Anaerolineaceae bacterium]|nr:DUF4159 domain-containing protein [Anaerolineaceae bacterium]
MNDKSSLIVFPKTKVKPYDGMSITSEVWGKAHGEHRMAKQAHDLYFHGPGIVTGLEVQANDPPDQYVFISPGVAVDSAGNVIVLTEPVAYDFGNAVEGELFLLLGHGEREIGASQGDVKYIQDEFVVAARPSIPKRPAVELARVTVSHKGNVIKNASNLAHPGVEEIDMRYRDQIGPEEKRIVKTAIHLLGKEMPADVIFGWDFLNRECKRSSNYQLIIDNQVPLDSALSKYSLLYLAGSGAFKLNKSEQSELKKFLDQGNGIIIEAFDEAAEESFKPFLTGTNITLKPVAEYDSLLKNPFLFNAAPEGSQGSKVLLGKGIIYSTAQYSVAWGGNVSAGTGSRTDIRSALEWGVNMIHNSLQSSA